MRRSTGSSKRTAAASSSRTRRTGFWRTPPARSATTGCGGSTRRRISCRGASGSLPRRRRDWRCLRFYDTRWRLHDGRCSSAPTQQVEAEADREQDHGQRRPLRLAEAVLDLVGAQVAEEEAADRIDAEEPEPEDAVREAGLEAAIEGQQQNDEPEAEDHLVGHLRVDHRAGVAEGMGVDVADAPGQRRRGSVVLAVDDVADPAHREPDQRRQAHRVEQLPEVDLGRGDVPPVGRARLSLRAAYPPVPVRPDPDPQHRSEDAAPLADPAFVDVEDLERRCLEQVPVLEDEVDARSEQADDHRPEGAVVDLVAVDPVGSPGDPLRHPDGGQDAEHAEDAVPGKREGADGEEVGVEVDLDFEEGHSARSILAMASSFGSRASVWWMGGELPPVTAWRIGLNSWLRDQPRLSRSVSSVLLIASGVHSTAFSAATPPAHPRLSSLPGDRGPRP